MLVLGIGSEIFASNVKSIINNKGLVSIVLESGIVFTQEEVEDYVASQGL